jgi:hypothetical protein
MAFSRFPPPPDTPINSMLLLTFLGRSWEHIDLVALLLSDRQHFDILDLERDLLEIK